MSTAKAEGTEKVDDFYDVAAFTERQIKYVGDLIYSTARSELGCVTSGDAAEISSRVRQKLEAYNAQLAKDGQ